MQEDINLNQRCWKGLFMEHCVVRCPHVRYLLKPVSTLSQIFNSVEVCCDAMAYSVFPFSVKLYLLPVLVTSPVRANQVKDDWSSLWVGIAWFIPSAMSEMELKSAGSVWEAIAVAKKIQDVVWFSVIFVDSRARFVIRNIFTFSCKVSNDSILIYFLSSCQICLTRREAWGMYYK